MSRRQTAITLTLSLTFAGCSFVVDDSPYGCEEGAECSQSPSRGACTPHRLCSDNKSLCVEDGDSVACRPLVNAAIGCNYTYPADVSSLGESDIFPIGVLAQWPSPGDRSVYGVPTTQAVEVAISNINAERGLPVANGATRKLLAIVCNEARPTPDDSLEGERPFLKPRVDHLVGKLQVAAIIGGSTSGATRQINGTHLDGSDALLLSPTATDDLLPDTWRDDEKGVPRQLFWRTVAPDGQQLLAINAVHALATTAITGASSGGSLAAISVYDSENSASQNLQNLFSLDGSFVDRTAFIYSSGDEESKDAAVAAIVRHGPRFILPFGTDEFVSLKRGDTVESMLADIEEQWDDAKFPRPWYILTEGNRSGDFRPALKKQPELVDRVIGAAPGARTSPLYQYFLNAYREYFRISRPNMLEGSSATPGNLAESGYDAVFLLAYAATKATRDGSWPRGPELAAAIDGLRCKNEGATLLQAYRNVFRGQVDSLVHAQDGCFDFEGASGPLDYAASPQSRHSPKAKDPTADFALWCLGNSNSADATADIRYYFSQEKMGIEARSGAAELSFRDKGWCAAAKN